MADPKDNVKNLNEELRKAYEAVAQTEEGQLVFRHIAALCLHNRGVRVLNPQTLEVNLVSTAIQAEKQQVYLEIRQWIPARLRVKIEN